MRIARTFTFGLAAAAFALTGITAAPARADDQALFNLLAGAAAVAIIAGAVNDNHYRGHDGWQRGPRYARWRGDGDRGWGHGGRGGWGPPPQPYYYNGWNR